MHWLAAILAAAFLLASGPARAQDEPATMVFFPTGSADLDERGRQELQGWAHVALENPDAQVMVTGHTDTAEDSTTAQALSERRAAAVAAELVRLGVPEDHITIAGVGDDELIVQTADGVSEPLNRRAGVMLAPERGIPVCPGDPRCKRKKARPPG